ncbi:MAG TPA: hypothetical protein PKA00_01770 [Saprospiraceae bacterium]|nr:hypothetical protein [Saprospiraceae bacterium]HMQ81598.1 hypothetical protein [Saprospiraceae bacterium]
MPTKYNPSVNILRDKDGEINYLPTPNAARVAGLISENHKNGIRAFNIIGSYGTGKSAFLWALNRTLQGKQHFFDVGGLEACKVEVLTFVGEFRSVSEFFFHQFSVENTAPSSEQVFAEIYHRYHQLGKKEGLLVLLIDEFGKFLEYAAKHNPEKELYFLQQLAEFVNDPVHNILLLTTLHQNFDTYSFSLNEAQRQEWLKVKGRFREVTFNEPVEQLLLLAGERLSQMAEYQPNEENVATIAELYVQSKAFALNAGFASNLALKLFPLDLFSASVAALAMQRYGQNERSLFSFLEDTNYTGIHRRYDEDRNPFFSLADLFDYLIFNYYNYINSKYNPDFSAWSGIKNALERIENEIENPNFVSNCHKLIKTVGLLNIFSFRGGNLGAEFLTKYLVNCLGIKEASSVLEALVERKILLYRNYEKRFVISEGTDVDIQSELLKAGDQVGDIGDVVNLLKKYFIFPEVFAKQHYYQTGTPRIFEFVISQQPESNLHTTDDTDGFVNLIFNERLTVEKVKEVSKTQPNKAVIYGYYKNAAAIRDLLREIEKTRKTKENVPKEDRVAQRELDFIKQHQESLLNHYILSNLHNKTEEVVWIFNGEVQRIRSKREFNTCLSAICKAVYSNAPHYRSELVNRSKLSSQIHTAKRAYLKHLVNYWTDENLGFDRDKFPPEKTIYLTLLRENSLVYDPSNPLAPITLAEGSSFHPLWQFGETFLENAKKHRYPLSEFSDALTKPPFKLKQGLIDFWLPTFLYLKKDEFALFGEGIYIPELSEATLELIAKRPQDFTVKTFDMEGVRLEIFNRYRNFLNQGTKEQVNNQTFIETIRPFLTFYKSLPEYAKRTNRLQKESLAVREAIATATDPEKTFFESLPNALGVSLQHLKKTPQALSDYIERLQDAIREIRSCHAELVNRFESFITSEVLYEPLDFEAYKNKLRSRFAKVKQHLLLPHQKTLLMRLASELDDRNAWLSSIAQAVVGRTLENLRDEDEPLLFEKFKDTILELDTLTQIAATDLDETKEEAFGLEITTFELVEKKILRYPKKKKGEINRLEEAIKTQLGNDKTLNIAALANLLKNLLKK